MDGGWAGPTGASHWQFQPSLLPLSLHPPGAWCWWGLPSPGELTSACLLSQRKGVSHIWPGSVPPHPPGNRLLHEGRHREGAESTGLWGAWRLVVEAPLLGSEQCWGFGE